MFALIIFSMNAYGGVANVVPNLTKAQCTALEIAIQKEGESHETFWHYYTISTVCVELPE